MISRQSSQLFKTKLKSQYVSDEIKKQAIENIKQNFRETKLREFMKENNITDGVGVPYPNPKESYRLCKSVNWS